MVGQLRVGWGAVVVCFGLTISRVSQVKRESESCPSFSSSLFPPNNQLPFLLSLSYSTQSTLSLLLSTVECSPPSPGVLVNYNKSLHLACG